MGQQFIDARGLVPNQGDDLLEIRGAPRTFWDGTRIGVRAPIRDHGGSGRRAVVVGGVRGQRVIGSTTWTAVNQRTVPQAARLSRPHLHKLAVPSNPDLPDRLGRPGGDRR